MLGSEAIFLTSKYDSVQLPSLAGKIKLSRGMLYNLKWENVIFIEFPTGAAITHLQLLIELSVSGKLGDSMTPRKPVRVWLQTKMY